MKSSHLKFFACLQLLLVTFTSLLARTPNYSIESYPAQEIECFKSIYGFRNKLPICSLDSVSCPSAYIGHCGESFDPTHTGWPTAEGTPLAPNYQCLHAAYSDSDLGGCGNSHVFNRIWTITNTNTSQSITCVQFISLIDDQAPIITCPSNMTVSCGSLDPADIGGYPTVFDACGSTYTLNYVDSPHGNCSGAPTTFLRTWTANDACDNHMSCNFTITRVCTPTDQANSIFFSQVSSSQMRLDWSNGNGDHRIVKINTSNNFTTPVEGSDPNANSVYSGSGEQVIYNGVLDNVIVTGLTANTTYWFRVYEANECAGTISYNVNLGVGNPKSQVTNGGCTPIIITSHPSTQFPIIPNPVTFSVIVTGSSPVYQWQFLLPIGTTWSNLNNSNNTTWTTGGNTSILTVHNTTGLNGYTYHCVINNNCSGPIISGPGEILASISSYIVYTKLPYVVAPFPNPYTLASGHISSPAPIIKICADGSKATIVSYTNYDGSINVNNIRFLIKSDPLGLNSEFSGYFVSTDYQTNGNTVTAKFTHPKYLSSSYLSFRPDTIKIVDIANSNSTLYKVPIQIYRAPVLFVHGFSGDGTTFASMSQDLVLNSNYYPSALNTIANYHSSSFEGFETNANVVPQWINKTFYNSLSGKFSAGKVDIICHSMGGILSRLYLQNNYGNIYRGDVNKLITINTPHSGSHLANYLVFHPLNIAMCIASPLFHSLSFTCNGAGIDMQTYSYATDHILNSPQSLLKGHVPSHTVTSYIDNIDIDNCLGSIPGLSPIYFVLLGITPFSVPEIFSSNTIQMDGVVRKDSQAAGLNGSQTSNSIYQCHIGAAANPINKSEIKQLLCSNPNGGQFSLNGFDPPDLFVSHPPISMVNIKQLQLKSVTMTPFADLLSPTNSDSFEPGQQITIIINTDTLVKRLIILVGNSSIGITYIDTLITSTLTNLEYSIPTNAIGQMEIDVVGLDSLINIIASDSVTFNINGPSILDSLEIEPEAILVPTNLQSNFQVIGHFSDGISRDISLVPGVLYSLVNPGIAQIVSPGVIEGTIIDSTKLTVSFEGFNDTIPVYVYNGDSLTHALFRASTNVICDSGQVIFSNLSSGHPQNFQWLFSGGNPSTSIQVNPIISYNSPGAYDVSLIATYSNKIDTLSLPGFIKVDSLPSSIITTSGLTSFCLGQSIELRASSGMGYNYLWSNDSTTQSITVMDSGLYSVTVFDNFGCSAESEIESIHVFDNPKPEITGVDSICTGMSTSIDGGKGFVSYIWSTNDTTQTINESATGILTITVTDNNGCTGTDDFTLTVTNPPFPIISGDFIFCAGDSTRLDGGDGYRTYLWSTMETSQIITTTIMGVYTLTVTDLNDCSGVSNPITITLNNLPNVDLGPDSIFISTPTTLDAGNPGSTYKWNTGDTTQTILVTIGGTYYVLVIDNNGCSSNDTIFVDITTDVIRIDEKEHLKIYPNPNSGIFTVSAELTTRELLKLRVTNSVGQVVYSSSPEPVYGKISKIINLNNPKVGIYYVQIELGNKNYGSKIIISN